MGRIATALPEFFLLWVVDPMRALTITLIGIGFLVIIYGLIWLKIDYPYWKMERYFRGKYKNG